MNVTFVTSGLRTGGAEFALLRLVKELRKSEIRSSVVSLQGLGTVGPMLRDASIDTLPLNLPAPRHLMFVIARLRSHMRAHGTALLHGWMYHGNLVALVAGRQLGIPVVWGIRQSLFGAQDKWLTRRVISVGASLSRGVDAIIYNSAAALAQHEARGYSAAHAAVVPNGFDTEQLRPNSELRATIRANLKITDDVPVVAQVARFHPGKDYPTLLHASARVLSVFPAATFLLIGEGVDESNADLVRLVNSLGLRDRVRLLGRRDDVSRLLAAIDIATLSSAGMEGFPNALGEAMSSGVPCVGTAVGDVPQLIGDTGEVVAPSNPEALAAAIVRLLALDPTARRALGARARERIIEKYSIGEVAHRYAELLISLSRLRR